MTLPESPAVQDMDRLREVASRAAATWALRYPIPAWQLAEGVQAEQLAARWGTQVADAVLGAVLPVHREMVLAEVAHELGRRATTVPWSDPTLKRGIQYAASVVSVLARDSATSPSPPPPGSPPADERATAVETGMELQDDGGYEPFVASAGETTVAIYDVADLAAAVPGTGDDPWRRRIDVSTIYGHELGAGDLAGVEAELVEARRERDEARAERNRLTETNARLEVERDDALALVAACTTRQQRRLAETIRKVREIHSPFPGDDPQRSLEPAAQPTTNTPVSLQVERPSWNVTAWRDRDDIAWTWEDGRWYIQDGYLDAETCGPHYDLDDLREHHGPGLTPLDVDNVPALLAEHAKLRTEHNRQYPTADAYEAACAALERHRQRADAAEAELDKVRAEAIAAPGAGDDPTACDRCRRPFDPDDKDSAGAVRYGESKFCRGCVDRCHESTDAFHECPVCAS